jgi:uncharacterized protein (DUF983 family)
MTTAKRPFGQYARSNKRDDRLEDIAATPCKQCGKSLGFEIFLSIHNVCGKCTRANHRRVAG